MHSRLLQLARHTKAALTLTILSAAFAGLLTIGQAWLVSATVDGVFLQKQTLPQVMGWLQLLLVIIATRGVLTWLNEVAANAVSVRIKENVRQQLLSHLFALGPAYSRREQTGDLVATAVDGIEALDAYYSQYLPQLVVSTLIPVSVLLIVFPLDPLSAIVLLLTAPLIPFFMYIIGKGAEVATGRQYETLRLLSAHFLDSLQGLTTLKLFGQSRAQVKNIARVSNQFRDATLKVLQVTFLSALALELLATLSTAIIAVEVGLRLLYGQMQFQQALFILILAPEFYLPLRMLGLRFHAGMSGTSAAKRIYQILDTPLPNTPAPTPQGAITSFSSLRFCDVSYTYPGEASPALSQIDLEIRAGQHIALVGPSGAGKTTLFSLLLRFFEPGDGEILVDSRLLSSMPADGWRSLLAWVPQKPFLFHDTIAANIRLGRSDATDEDVIQAARLAHLNEFIDSLPDKYETCIGEDGARLSSGQAQRLALARAFLKDAPLLLLDEPTSSVDPETEALLEESTRRLMQGRTVITIAHRLNTIFNADRIVLLEAGRIVETGSHAELLASKGTYSRMVDTYASGIPEIQPGELAPPAPLLNAPLQSASGASPIDSAASGTIFWRLTSFLKDSWAWVFVSVLLSTLTIGSSIALMGTSAWLISMAGLHPSIAVLEVSIVGVRFFGIARGVFRYVERLVSHNVTFRLLSRLRVWFYEKMEPLAPARLMEYHAGDLLARIIGDVEVLENFYIRVVAPPLTAALVGAGTALFLSWQDLALAWLLIGFFLLLGVVLPLLSQVLSRRPGAQLIDQRALLQTGLVDGIQGMTDLLAFGRAGDLLNRANSTGKRYGEAQQRMACISGLHAGLSVVLTNLGLWGVLFVSVPLATAGRLSGVMLASLALLTMASFEAVTSLPLAAQAWNMARAAARRLFEIVDASPAIEEQAPLLEAPATSSIEFSDVSFAYPGHPALALEHVSFQIRPGQRIAIVGPSGAGKSTLASLLLRFWEYSSGDILLGGRSLHDYTQEAIRAQIGFAPPDTHFFNTSVRENLRMARRHVSQEEIEAAARRACIHDAILAMARGYDTRIGEHGQRLSGGERQRLALARAIIKNAPILILDEPTANLDPLTERRVMETLFSFMKGKTCLLITHRLVGLENMDEILVMDHGRIVERGSHASLVIRGGLYRRLYDLQARVLAEPAALHP